MTRMLAATAQHSPGCFPEQPVASHRDRFMEPALIPLLLSSSSSPSRSPQLFQLVGEDGSVCRCS